MAESLPDPRPRVLRRRARRSSASTASDVEWCQAYAFQNREIMMDRILRQLAYALGFEGDVARLGDHDVGQLPSQLHRRRGALRPRRCWSRARARSARAGRARHHPRLDGDRLLHRARPGQRRVLRERAARRRPADVPQRGEAPLHEGGPGAQTEGVECRKDRGVLDEIPGAYKPIGEVIEKSSDLVEVVAGLKQIVCVKG